MVPLENIDRFPFTILNRPRFVDEVFYDLIRRGPLNWHYIPRDGFMMIDLCVNKQGY